MWDHRNEALHQSPKNWKNILESLVNDKIWQFYALGSGALPCNAMQLLATLLEVQLVQPINTKTLWIELIKAAILHKARYNYSAMVGEQRLMQQCLGLE